MPSAQAADVCPANPSPVDAADPSIIVNAPAPGQTISSPVTVSGQARVFEANVRITIFDATGTVLADTFTTASEAAPALAPFSAQVPFAGTTAQQACVRVFEESAQDGSPRNVVQVEVNLSTPTKPPATGTAGMQDESDNEGHLMLYGAGVLVIVGAVALAAHRRFWN